MTRFIKSAPSNYMWNVVDKSWDLDSYLYIRKKDPVWDDLRVPAQNTKLNPSKAEPNFESFIGGTFVYKFDNNNADDESVHFVAQLPHAWKGETNLRPHLHWAPDTTNTGSVVWSFEYTVVRINGTFPATTTSEVTDPADGTANKHQIIGFDEIDGSDLSLSSMLVCRLTRLGTDGADTYTGNACFLEFDFHYQIDSLGSEDEFVKTAV